MFIVHRCCSSKATSGAPRERVIRGCREGVFGDGVCVVKEATVTEGVAMETAASEALAMQGVVMEGVAMEVTVADDAQ
eukprot:805408-Alexandrium_andersonii.AAC.1